MTAAPLLGVPLIGAMAAGLLGIRGLPRLWQKGLLESAGVLSSACAYPDADESRMLAALGIPFAAFNAFVMQRPAYLETEAWVAGNGGGIATWDGVAAAARRENLLDLDGLHAFVDAYRGSRDVAFSPAISPLLAGELGLLHLPRLWAKAMIDAIGLLPDGYNSGKGPLDEQLATAIGFDLAAAMRYVRAERPTHAAFEEWVQQHAATLDAGSRHTWNERISGSKKPEHVAAPERELLGIADPNERGGVLLNHLIDMYFFRLEVVAA
jgi:hypothetical protein